MSSRFLRCLRPAPGVGAAALVAGVFVLSAAGGTAADQFLPADDGWETYVNDRYGTRLAFPAESFVPQAPPENGDGRSFTSEDATLEVYGWDNIDDESAASLKRRLIGAEGYDEVSYSPSGPGWVVLSGYRGDNIFYEKYFFRDGTIQGFGMEFPAEEKPYYAPLIERIEDSFRSGPAD